MKRIAIGVVICLGLALPVARANWITEAQSYVVGALGELKFKSVPTGVIGGPQKFHVTQETIDHLHKLMKDKKTLVVEGNGSIKVE